MTTHGEMNERTYIDMLRDELAEYERKRAEAAAKLADDPEYAARVDAMWGYAIAAQLAKIEREETRGHISHLCQAL